MGKQNPLNQKTDKTAANLKQDKQYAQHFTEN